MTTIQCTNVSKSPKPSTDVSNWTVPTIDEIDELRSETELSKGEFSEMLGYSNRTAFAGAVTQNSIGYARLRQSVLYLRQLGIVSYWAPTLDEIDDARKARDIRKNHFSDALGYTSPSAFGTCISKGAMATEKYRASIEVLRYYDRNGIIPLPSELDCLDSDW